MKTGVCLVQLGTPDEPTVPAVRRYLEEFLLDRRVVDLTPWLWKPILYGIILRTRPKRSAANYQLVWTDEGSPLLLYTESLARKLGAALGDDFVVNCGMRIGNPSVGSRLDELVEAGCERILVLPCYPQWSTATNLSVEDAVGWWRDERPDAPETVVIGSFPDHPAYIAALARSVREAGVEASAEAPLVISFHGIPQKYADKKGDPYPQECEATARALAAALELPEDAWRIAYQSRFGPAAWLQPYCDELLQELAESGIRTVSVVSPSFLADCLETIDEIGRELREEFEEAGGTSFTRVPCLNDADDLVDALAEILRANA
ncbi:MAG: ferrochelatase [Planctomycetota bacterium]|nr:ferrochelatase [Planctomycetota bacterium]